MLRNEDQMYMKRAIELARRVSTSVKTNPQVGAVIVYDGRIIGEGFHAQYGKEHAEVNAVASVREEDRKWLAHASIYVSLEPCNFFGKTPACTDLILKHGMKKLFISCIDKTPEV